MSSHYTFALSDMFNDIIKVRIRDYMILEFVKEAERSGYKDKLYLYLKLARMIVKEYTQKVSGQLYVIGDISTLMDDYYDDMGIDDRLVLKFIYYVYFRFCPFLSSFKRVIWSAFDKHLLYLCSNLDEALDLHNISIMRYRAHSFIAESEIKRMIHEEKEDENEIVIIYSHIVDIVRKCVNDEYDLSEWIEEEYTTHSFGDRDDEENDEIYQLHCPTYYSPNDHCNFKLLREDINMERSKRFLVNTVLVELKVLIDLHIDIEHKNEIHDAINTIREDKNLSIYILPSAQLLLDDSFTFIRLYFGITHLCRVYDEYNMPCIAETNIAIDILDESLQEMLEWHGRILSRHIHFNKFGKKVINFKISDATIDPEEDEEEYEEVKDDDDEEEEDSDYLVEENRCIIPGRYGEEEDWDF